MRWIVNNCMHMRSQARSAAADINLLIQNYGIFNVRHDVRVLRRWRIPICLVYLSIPIISTIEISAATMQTVFSLQVRSENHWQQQKKLPSIQTGSMDTNVQSAFNNMLLVAFFVLPSLSLLSAVGDKLVGLLTSLNTRPGIL